MVRDIMEFVTHIRMGTLQRYGLLVYSDETPARRAGGVCV